MKLLLDTHTFLWFLTDDRQLSAIAARLIADRSNDVIISVASLWEIAIKVSNGKLNLGGTFADIIPAEIEKNHLDVIGVDLAHLNAVSLLPFHHRDPFDRLIIAQSLVEEMPLLSVDSEFDAYGVDRRW